MNKLARAAFAGAAIAMPLVMVGTSPAAAANVDVAVITGSGTISPGLSVVPVPQSISFSGSATVVGTHGVLTTYGCSFSGSDINGSIAAGVGTVSGSCGPISFDTCVFVRVLDVVQVVCAGASASGPTVKGASAECVFQPNNTLPTTSYTLTCKAEYVGQP